MNRMIYAFMAALCLNFSAAMAQDFETRMVGDYQIITRGQDEFAIVGGKELPLHKREKNQQGPVNYDLYVFKPNGERFSITDAWYEKMKAEGKKVIRFREHPEGKPFVRYTSPKTGKKYKWYDILRIPEGRILTREEFNSFNGNFTWGKRIDGGIDAMDTTIIIPPTELMIKKEEARKAAFKAIVGQAAPAFNVTDLTGQSYSTEDLKGKVVVLNFWFTGCPPCVKEMPELNDLEEKYRNQEVVFLGIATDPVNRLEKFLEKRKFNYHIIPNALALAERDWNVLYYPSHFIIDQSGVVSFLHEGYDENLIKTIDNKIAQLLK